MAIWFGMQSQRPFSTALIKFSRALLPITLGDGLGGFVVEATAALSILLYLAALWSTGRWNQKFSHEGFYYSALTGICVGAGTIAFFLLFQKGGPLSAVLGSFRAITRMLDLTANRPSDVTMRETLTFLTSHTSIGAENLEIGPTTLNQVMQRPPLQLLQLHSG
jgi:hypothetical protein